MPSVITNQELMHYGVLGMKWGKRKATGYVTVRQASKNAKAAMDKARKDSIAADKAKSRSGERVTYRQASKNASEAMKTARKESIAKDKANNKQLRDKNNLTKEEKRKLIKVGSGLVTGLMASRWAGQTVGVLTGNPVLSIGASVAAGYYGAVGGMTIAEALNRD